MRRFLLVVLLLLVVFVGAVLWHRNVSHTPVSSSSPTSPTTSAGLAAQIKAAQSTANTSAACKAISKNTSGSNDGFYWEIGDQNGIITDSATGLKAAGSVGTNYTRTTSMLYASASKFIYGTYVAQVKATQSGGSWQMPAPYVPHLNFTSGYTNMQDAPVQTAPTTEGFLSLKNSSNGLPFGTLNSVDVGHFHYNGGHMEVLAGGGDPALGDAMGEAGDSAAAFTAGIRSVFSAHGISTNLSFWSSWPAGGGRGTAADYAAVLQGIVRTSNPLTIKFLLKPSATDPYAVCTNPTAAGCNATYTPIRSRNWHYGLGHWIEDDSRYSDDGAYSSPGAFGFYPWVDATKTYYGIIARQDKAGGGEGFTSALCGETIRKAFMTGSVQS